MISFIQQFFPIDVAIVYLIITALSIIALSTAKELGYRDKNYSVDLDYVLPLVWPVTIVVLFIVYICLVLISVGKGIAKIIQFITTQFNSENTNE